MNKEIKEIYTKYHLSAESDSGWRINLYAKVSKDKITLRTYADKKKFEFTLSDKDKTKEICELILKAIEKK